jgi:hypothetical protein
MCLFQDDTNRRVQCYYKQTDLHRRHDSYYASAQQVCRHLYRRIPGLPSDCHPAHLLSVHEEEPVQILCQLFPRHPYRFCYFEQVSSWFVLRRYTCYVLIVS